MRNCYFPRAEIAVLDDALRAYETDIQKLQHRLRDDSIVEKRRFAIGDLVLQCDPCLGRHFLGRCDLLPMGKHPVLHPIEVARIVHVSHEVDIFGQDLDRKLERRC